MIHPSKKFFAADDYDNFVFAETLEEIKKKARELLDAANLSHDENGQ